MQSEDIHPETGKNNLDAQVISVEKKTATTTQRFICYGIKTTKTVLIRPSTSKMAEE